MRTGKNYMKQSVYCLYYCFVVLIRLFVYYLLYIHLLLLWCIVVSVYYYYYISYLLFAWLMGRVEVVISIVIRLLFRLLVWLFFVCLFSFFFYTEEK